MEGLLKAGIVGFASVVRGRVRIMFLCLGLGELRVRVGFRGS